MALQAKKLIVTVWETESVNFFLQRCNKLCFKKSLYEIKSLDKTQTFSIFLDCMYTVIDL